MIGNVYLVGYLVTFVAGVALFSWREYLARVYGGRARFGAVTLLALSAVVATAWPVTCLYLAALIINDLFDLPAEMRAGRVPFFKHMR